MREIRQGKGWLPARVLPTGGVTALAVLAAVAGMAPVRAQTMPDFLNEEKPRARVLLLGTFHFKDAGLDDHKPQHGFDAMSEERQKEIAEVLDLLAVFNPTVIAVERKPRDQARLDEAYNGYLAGERELGPNEIYQIGFRLGKRLGLERLIAVDAPSRSYFPEMTQEQYEARVASLMEGIDPVRIEAEMAWDGRFEQMYLWEDNLTDNQTLREHLIYSNDEDVLRRHHGHYLVTEFKLGRGEDYFGVDSRTSWYNRNLRIFQNIQRATRGPEDRILVLIGAGHVPILRHAVEASPEYELVEVRDMLDPVSLPTDRLDRPHPDAPPEMEQFGFLVGEWDCTLIVKQADGTVAESDGRWVGYYTLGGYAFQDDWYSSLGFQGTTWRSYDPTNERWINMWLRSNTDSAPGFADGFFYGGLEDGEIRLTATGEDDQGSFIDRIRFTDIEDNGFTWRMSRSYDGGKTWAEDAAVVRARRVR
jgi:hypothetical protein